MFCTTSNASGVCHTMWPVNKDQGAFNTVAKQGLYMSHKIHNVEIFILKHMRRI